jgi:hypothetical protein
MRTELATRFSARWHVRSRSNQENEMTHPLTTDVGPSSTRPAQHDLFGPIHKAIRFALCDLLAKTGGTSFADGVAVEELVARTEHVLSFCERHADLEDEFILPILAGRARSGFDVLDGGHPRLRRLVEEIRSLLVALPRTSADRRAEVGRVLYRHVAAFVAENLTHMNEEEHVVEPLLRRLYPEHELIALSVRIVAKLSPDEHRASVGWMLRASSREERIGMVATALGRAPREQVVSLLESVRTALPEQEYADLIARCGASAGGVG